MLTGKRLRAREAEQPKATPARPFSVTMAEHDSVVRGLQLELAKAKAELAEVKAKPPEDAPDGHDCDALLETMAMALDELTVPQLEKLARFLDVEGAGELKKAELIGAFLDACQQHDDA